jgi:hypothetical protein
VLQQIALGSILMVVTTIVHSGCTLAALLGLRMTRANLWGLRTRSGRMGLVSALVLMMFFAALLEVTIWAAVYLAVGAISTVEPALYFSMVTFTTLGYGDVVLKEGWRLLASFEAASGIIMFGWTTALIFAVVQRLASHDERFAGGTHS